MKDQLGPVWLHPSNLQASFNGRNTKRNYSAGLLLRGAALFGCVVLYDVVVWKKKDTRQTRLAWAAKVPRLPRH